MVTELDVVVYIDGVSLGQHVVSVTSANDVCQGVGGVTVVLDSSYVGTINPASLLWVEEYGQRVFTGYVNGFKREVPPAQCTIVGSDVLKKAKDYFLADPVYSSGQTVAYWIEYFLDLAGLTLRVVDQTSSTVPPDTVFELEYIIEIIKKLCSTEGWVIFADEIGVVYVGDYVSYGTPATSFTEGDNLISVNRHINDDWIRNKINVWGDGAVMATVEDLANPYMDGEIRAAAIYSQRITTNAQAQELADKLAVDMAAPYDGKMCEVVGNGDYFTQVGDTVLIQDTFTGLNQSCLVYTVEDRMGPDKHTRNLGLDAKCPYYWGWGSGVVPASGIAYIGHKSEGVYRHTIVTDSSVLRNVGLTGTALNIHDLKVNPHTYGEGKRHMWITTDDGVYKTENDAQLWTKVTLPAPANTAEDSPAPTVADLEWYSVEFDKVQPRVVHVLAGYILPNDRLWLYTTKDYGLTWASVGLHLHSALGGGWTKHWAANMSELVYFPATDCLYMCACYPASTVPDTIVYEYNGGGGVPTQVLDIAEPPGVWTWPNEQIEALVVTDDGRLWVVGSHIGFNGGPNIEKVTVHVTTDGTNWTKVLDTNTGLGLNVSWQAVRSTGGTNDGFSCVVAIARYTAAALTLPMQSYIIRCQSSYVWSVDLTGDNSDYPLMRYEAFGKAEPYWGPLGSDLVWVRDNQGRTAWRIGNGVWELEAVNSVEWGKAGCFYTCSYQGYLYAYDYDDTKIKRCYDGYTWSTIGLAAGVGQSLGVFEDRLVVGVYDKVYIETTPGRFQTDYSAAAGTFRFPQRFVEIWDTLWCVTARGLWYRNDGPPAWRMDMRRSEYYADQGHQYSLATLPNYPWVVYVAAARESGGNEYLRVLRIHTEKFGSIMSYDFDSTYYGYVRVSAPPNNTSDEIVYAFGYGTNGALERRVWRFETDQAPADKTGVGWAATDKIATLLHDDSDLDWVALMSLLAVYGTLTGGTSWSSLIAGGILTDGGDRIGNLILAGKATAGVPTLEYSEDRAITWDSQGASIDNSAGIASVQIVDKYSYEL